MSQGSNFSRGGERPITDFAGDRLARRGFVERIAEGLISDDASSARGVVIGVTGPWGSGKSSILNLVDAEIRRRAPQAVIVRFDPWVISGQQDLILSFLRETIRTIAAEPTRAKRARALIKGLSTYAEYLAPVFNVFAKGSGDVFKGLAKSVQATIDGDQTLVGQRKKLEELIISLGVPVVVLIDELDRVEDDEVRAVAQLVRAVGDFSGVSYLLAYDPQRVAKALGKGHSDDHGRAYLEKIVQLPLALPVALPGELRAMLDVEVDLALSKLKMAGIFQHDLHYDDIAAAITPRLASTPRDIKRLVGIFHPLMAMVMGEVAPADVLGFAALMAKAPQTVEQIAAHPNTVVDDPLTFDETIRRVDLQAGSGAPHKIVVEPEAEILVARLFPALSGRRFEEPQHAYPISQWRRLMTVLRLGVLPSEDSRTAAETLLRSSARDVAVELERIVEEGSLPQLLEGLLAIYTDRFDGDDLGFWRGVASYLNRTDLSHKVRYGLLRNLAANLATMLESAAARRPDAVGKARRIVEELRAMDDLMLMPLWLKHHLAIHGIGVHGRKVADGIGGPWFLSAADTANLMNNALTLWKDAATDGRLYERLNSVEPLRLLARLAFWEPSCKAGLTKALPSQAAHLAALFYLPEQDVSAAFISTLCGVPEFLQTVEARLELGALGESETLALTHALAHLSRSTAAPTMAPFFPTVIDS